MPRVRNSDSISSKNTTTGCPWDAFSRARAKISRMCRSVSPTYLLSSSGPLTLRKKLFASAASSPARGRGRLGERVGHRLGDERLAAAGRAVQQHALGRLEPVLAEQVGVQERQLDRVADRLDLRPEAADVGVVDVRDLLEHELLDLGARDALEDEPAARLDGQRVADPHRRGRPRAGPARRTTRSSSACPTTSARSPPSISLTVTSSPTALVPAGLDHGEGLVEHDLLAGAQRGRGPARGSPRRASCVRPR